jgi:adenine-specific DNA-methyltransferase
MLMTPSIDQRRTKIASETSAARKSELGQFMTPTSIAQFMSSLFTPFGNQSVRLLDAGAGIGSLTAAFASKALEDQVKSLDVEVWEIDPKLSTPLTQTLEGCQKAFQDSGSAFSFTSKLEDFVDTFKLDLFSDQSKVFTHAILNPPYKKIKSVSQGKNE